MGAEEELKAMLEAQKKQSFIEPDKATDQEAAGLLLARYFKWDGVKILEAAYSALEDANFHTENETIRQLIDRAKKDFN